MLSLDRRAHQAVDSLTGRMLGGYRLLRKLGRGGTATVYLAEKGPERVAVKVLRADVATNPEGVQRFLSEGRTLSLIANDHVVRVLLSGSDPLGHFVVMELLEGEPLSARIRRGPVMEPEALTLLSQICSALASMHRAGVIHRDLKPDNIMVCQREGSPFVKLLDLGLAKVFDLPGRLRTRAGAVMGTPAYMSPEQCRSEPVDARSDLYALGVIAFELTTGRPPFLLSAIRSMLVAHERTLPPLPRALRPELSQPLERIILTLLAKRPVDRFPDAATTFVELQQARELLATADRRFPVRNTKGSSVPPRSRINEAQ